VQYCSCSSLIHRTQGLGPAAPRHRIILKCAILNSPRSGLRCNLDCGVSEVGSGTVLLRERDPTCISGAYTLIRTSCITKIDGVSLFGGPVFREADSVRCCRPAVLALDSGHRHHQTQSERRAPSAVQSIQTHVLFKSGNMKSFE
jgi:hypothetical protein